MHRWLVVATAALMVIGAPDPAGAQPEVAKGVVATLKIPKVLLSQGRGMGGRYYYGTVEMTDYGVVVASRANWRTIVPAELVDHTVLKVSKWKKPKKKKGVQIPGYTQVSLLRGSDREIIRLRFINTRRGEDLDRLFWEVAFSGKLSPEQSRDYTESIETAEAAPTAAGPAVAVKGAPATAEIQSRYFTTSDAVRLHYLDIGRGPLVLFVPGWAMPARIWRAQMAGLGRDHRVVALDPRSQGQSEVVGEGLYPERRAQDIHELIRHLNASRVVLVGWSLAVQELLAYVDAYGTQELEAVVFVDGPVKTDGERVQTTRDRILHEIQRDRANLTERFVRGMFRRPQEEAYLRQVVAWSLKTPTSSAFTLLGEYQVLGRDLSEALGKVNCPLLYVITPGLKDEAEIVTGRVPGARVEVFAEAGHALFVDEADRFNELLRRFIGGQ